MKVMFELPFIYHFEDYHEATDCAKFLSATLNMNIDCEEMDTEEYPTSAYYPSEIRSVNMRTARNFYPFLFDKK